MWNNGLLLLPYDTAVPAFIPETHQCLLTYVAAEIRQQLVVCLDFTKMNLTLTQMHSILNRYKLYLANLHKKALWVLSGCVESWFMWPELEVLVTTSTVSLKSLSSWDLCRLRKGMCTFNVLIDRHLHGVPDIKRIGSVYHKICVKHCLVLDVGYEILPLAFTIAQDRVTLCYLKGHILPPVNMCRYSGLIVDTCAFVHVWATEADLILSTSQRWASKLNAIRLTRGMQALPVHLIPKCK